MTEWHVSSVVFVAACLAAVVLLFTWALCRAAALSGPPRAPLVDCWALVRDGWPRHLRILHGDDAA